jgi:hypothetical protein
MEEVLWLTPAAVVAMRKLTVGPAMYKLVLQVAKSADPAAGAVGGAVPRASLQRRPLMMLSESQQSMLPTAINHLISDATLHFGSVVHL